MFKFIPSG